MPERADRRRTSLLLAAALLPAVLLAALAFHLLRQERELAVRRVEDARELRAARLGQQLLPLLNALLPPDAGPDPEAVVGRGVLTASGLRWAWDPAARPPVADRSGSARLSEYRSLLDEGQAAEFTAGRPDRAAARYGRALAIAPDTAAAAAARLMRARALVRAGQAEEARADYLALLELPLHWRDADGLPFSLYAAERLAAEPSAAALLRLAADSARALPLPALYAFRDLAASGHGAVAGTGDAGADAAAGSGRADAWLADVVPRLEARIEQVERLAALAGDLPALVNYAGGGAGRWVPHGTPLWLVHVAGEQVVVVDPAALAPGLAGAGMLTTAAAPEAPLLGAALPGLRARIPDAVVAADAARSGTSAALLLTGLPLVLALTMTVLWLLWRDVRRDVAAAAQRSRFVSGVSHELKTPLTSIRMFAETLRLRGGAAEPALREEYLDTIVHESERLTRLINNVLDFSRIERGDMRYRPRPEALDEVIREALAAMRYPLEQADIRVHVSVEPDLPPCSVDRDALSQAVLNLLANAVKFSPTGSRIDVRLARAGSCAEIEVADQGRGVPPAERERIFQEFYRSADVEAEGIPGTGLGLSLVAHVARGHGGSVHVRSAPGGGSVFTLSLPLGGENAAPRAVTRPASEVT
ncbi:MAG: HAMP domain-containing sensor histidine kinase [Gemmatimonadota bacterium]